MPIATPFSISSSFCYQAAKNDFLELIAKDPEVLKGEPFKIEPFIKKLLDSSLYVSREQLNNILPDGHTVERSLTYFIKKLAKKPEKSPFIWSREHKYFYLKSDTELQSEITELVDETDDEDVNEVDFDGWIYAFTYPILIQEISKFPIKIGKTSVDVNARVATQCRGSAIFDNPMILGSWKVSKVSHIESAIHSVLKARGRWRENVPGTEWFDTSLSEIDSVIQFILGNQPL
jgi:hypothetical protein